MTKKTAAPTTHKPSKKHTRRIPVMIFHSGQFLFGIACGLVLLMIIAAILIYIQTQQFESRIFPGIHSGPMNVGSFTPEQVTAAWIARNQQFVPLTFTLQFESHIATLSAEDLDIGFDATTSATQAYLLGRSGNLLSDIMIRYQAWTAGITLSPVFHWKQEAIEETITTLATSIDEPPHNALFDFANGRVTAFKPSRDGRKLNRDTLRQQIYEEVTQLANHPVETTSITIPLLVEVDPATITTENVNNLGIKELVGSGESYFRGSIPGRIHNVALAASRVNGVLVAPDETFSFNAVVGDISAATGYKQAYVIKSGRTVLDDGGGVCQVSTTLFRAALNAGLPILERHAHSYRVGYYEQGGWKPGFDATVYAPSYDLKIKNDTGHHLLIQATTDTKNTHLVFEFYGTRDNRTVEISPVRLWDAKPAPPDLYQDDPTLPTGTIKQVDWANPGIKASFDYVVKKDNQELFKKSFFSNFVPWQAVFLRGTGS